MKRLAALLGLLACAACEAAPAPWHSEAGHRWRELPDPGTRNAGFRAMRPRRTGVRFENGVDGDSLNRNRVLGSGSGVTVGDVDGDGRPELFLAGVDGHSRLYRNLGRWRFEDATGGAGLERLPRHATGAAFADVDGDDHLDLLVASTEEPLALFVNDGHGRFRYATEEAGLGGSRGGTSITLADVDGDADLDLYVSNYAPRFVADIVPPQQRAFDQVIRMVNGAPVVREQFRDHYGVVIDHERRTITRTELGAPDWFFLNDGRGRFSRVPPGNGALRDEHGQPLPEDRLFGLCARFLDLTGDRVPDLYVCNDFDGPDFVGTNDGTGRFRALSSEAIRATSFASMGMDASDIDRDGHDDLLVLDMLSRDSRRRKAQIPLGTPPVEVPGEYRERRQITHNVLLRSRGDGSFAQIAGLAGVAATDWSWAALFLDADLDGYEDLFVTNGYPWDALNADVIEGNATMLRRVSWEDEPGLFPSLPAANVALRNRGDLTFSDSTDWDFAQGDDISHGMAAGDLDGDGDLDLVVNRWGEPALLLRNEGGASRIAVRLSGQGPNTQGVGARIRVSGGPVREQTKEVAAGGLYLSGSEALYSFAAGDAERLTVTVEWRSGRTSVVRDARPGRLYEIREPASGTPGTEAAAPARREQEFFEDVSERLSHRHRQPSFEEYQQQPLLPHYQERVGPGLSWLDADGDGHEDLFVSAGSEQRPVYYRNVGGRFLRAALPLPPGPEQTVALGLPDGQGGLEVLLGQAAATALPGAPAVIRVAARPGGAAEPVVGALPFSAGALALADVDGDADLDLFVGARVVPGAFPSPAASRLFRNEQGRFVEDRSLAPQLAGLGLVAGASFADFDADGDPDLLVAPAFGPVRLFRNQGGRLVDAVDRAGLPDVAGWWNGMATGDLNGDGSPDIVLTSWGRNTRWRASRDRPLLLYPGDFDGNGVLDPVLARYDPYLRAVAPLQSFPRLSLAIQGLRRRIPTFEAFAHSDLAAVLGPALGRVRPMEVRTLDHTLLLSDTASGRYRAVPLPSEAQFAPAFFAGVSDLDGDGRLDLFLGQNFFANEPGTPRYDAGLGLWLRGDGRGGLAPVPAARSGIRVYGEQRGAALGDFDADGRIDLAVGQNGAEVRLFRNRGAKVGLRVRLLGSRDNPEAVGAVIRADYGERLGPALEIQAGAGHLSKHGAVQVLGDRQAIRSVVVRWPHGATSVVPAPVDAAELVIRHP